MMAAKQSPKRKSMHIDQMPRDDLKQLKTLSLQNQIDEQNQSSEPILINLHQ